MHHQQQQEHRIRWQAVARWSETYLIIKCVMMKPHLGHAVAHFGDQFPWHAGLFTSVQYLLVRHKGGNQERACSDAGYMLA